ncbi:unnamed protein product [Tetraodon nigroviridis]|uniref:(spotted green pufferfish) hypothetical protein n=1 Tax=Tetraodon nigroviridis TaxID=99883 RepID=Q4S2H1_TETNG|nr:unnamed protein product [Tetraodon nigroviridis]
MDLLGIVACGILGYLKVTRRFPSGHRS